MEHILPAAPRAPTSALTGRAGALLRRRYFGQHASATPRGARPPLVGTRTRTARRDPALARRVPSGRGGGGPRLPAGRAARAPGVRAAPRRGARPHRRPGPL